MAEGSTPDSGNLSRQPGGHNERFATLVEGDRAQILAAYGLALAESQSPLVAEPRSREQTLVNAAEILTDVEKSVRADAVLLNERYKWLARTMRETLPTSKPNPADLLRASAMFFNVTVNALARHVSEDPDLLPSFLIAVCTLNESIDARIREATLAFTRHLLDRVHGAHLDERHRIARELHDRLGEGVSGALRQLELHELTELEQPIEPTPHTALAKRALMEAMNALRHLISDLRWESVTCLEKALNGYVASVAANVDVRVRVSGDESWAASTVIDEAFMIIREALRNALTHGAPQLVLIAVDVAPHELRARIDDDGRGVEPQRGAADGSVCTAGLAIMRERAALIGGRLSVSSSPGHGTHVELLVPLPGPRQE